VVYLLFYFHRLTAAVDGAVSTTGNNNLGTALGAVIPLAYLVCHIVLTPPHMNPLL
jgi:hypothetical protein